MSARLFANSSPRPKLFAGVGLLALLALGFGLLAEDGPPSAAREDESERAGSLLAHTSVMAASVHGRMCRLHPIESSSLALALGEIAGGQGAESPAGLEARGHIRGWIEDPRDELQLENGLLAAGNAGHDELVAGIGRHIDHESPTVRKLATKALRQMSPDEAYPHLEQALDDEASTVRGAALESALSVAHKHDRAPSEELVGLAGERLDAPDGYERHAAIALLGEAARRGDVDADELLRSHLRSQLASGEADPKQLAALGRGTPGHWRRVN